MKNTHRIVYDMYIDDSAGYFKTLGAESANINNYLNSDKFWQHFYKKILGMITPELIEEAKQMAIAYVNEYKDQVVHEFDVKIHATVTSARWGTSDHNSSLVIYTHKP